MSFGFTVKKSDELNEFGKPVGWKVSLPHQCDRWMIAGEDSYIDDDGFIDKVKAEEAFAEFLNEGRRALEALVANLEFRVPEVAEPSDPWET